MNNRHTLQPNPTFFGIGIIIGLALGLFIGWGLWPVEWEGATLRDLETSEKAEYIAAVADAFVIYDSPEAAANARRRLAPLEENVADELSSAIRYFRLSNQPEQNIRISNIRQLASSLGILVSDVPLVSNSAQEQPAGDVAVATAAPVSGVAPDTQSQTDITAGTDAAVSPDVSSGSAGSWLRSLLWFLAILLILGGTLFLLGASGLVDWRRWWATWAAWVEGNRPNRNAGRDSNTVDEFDDENDYSDFDHFEDYQQFDYVDEFDEPDSAQTVTPRRRPDRPSSNVVADADDYSFESEAFDNDIGHGQTRNRPVTDWQDPYDTNRPQVRQQWNASVSDDNFDGAEDEFDDDDFSNEPQPGRRSTQETAASDMFRPTDFEEIDAKATIPGYEIAYAGHRYIDDATSEEKRTSSDDRDGSTHEDFDNAPDDNDFDDEFDTEFDDDIADEHWNVPTVKSVLTTTPKQPPVPEDPPADDVATHTPDSQEQSRPKASVAHARATDRQPSRSPQPAPQPARGRTRHKVIDQHTLHYQLGIPEYDESKPIVDPSSGKYIGEFGMGASIKNGLLQANPEQIVALEVWLFDKTDEQSIGNQTRILLSEYAVDHNLDQVLLKERRDNPRPFTAQPGVHFQLEGHSLLLDCTIVDVEYVDSGANKGMFQNIRVDMSVHQKA